MPPEGSRRLDQPHYPDRRQMGSSAGLQLQASLGALCCNLCLGWNHLSPVFALAHGVSGLRLVITALQVLCQGTAMQAAPGL